MFFDKDDPEYQAFKEKQRRVKEMSYAAEKRYINDREYRNFLGRDNNLSTAEIDEIRKLHDINLCELTDRELAELRTHIMIDILERLGRQLTYSR